MADSAGEKKRRKPKEEPAPATVEEPTPVVDDAAPKKKKKAKKPVEEDVEPKYEEVVEAEPKEQGEEKKKSKKSGAKTEEDAKPQEEEAPAPKAEPAREEKPPTSGEEAPADQPSRKDSKLKERRKSSFGLFISKVFGGGKSSSSSSSAQGTSPREEPAKSQPAQDTAKPSNSSDTTPQEAPTTGSKKKKSSKQDKEAEKPVPELQEAQDGEEGAEKASAKPPRKKKRRSSSGEVKPVEENTAGDDAEVPVEEGEPEEEEDKPRPPPPRIPPPSAPKKAPLPVQQPTDAVSVFSSKPIIKFDVEEQEEAKTYDVEDAKRVIDFTAFIAANPHYTVGKEVNGTAYNRIFEAKSAKGPPEHVYIKFYSNEPPRLLPEAAIVSHVALLRSLQDNTHILPLLDEFVGEDYVDPHAAASQKASSGKDEAHSDSSKGEEAEPPADESHKDKEEESKKEAKEDKKEEKVVEKEEEAPKEGEKKKRKKDKKAKQDAEEKKKKDEDKQKEEDKAAAEDKKRPEPVNKPPTKPPVDAAPAKKPKSFEPDHYLVFEALPDVIRYAIESESGVYTEKKVTSIITNVLKALQAVHASGHMHRAIAPTNVVVTNTGEAKLTGFDMACKIAEPNGNVLTSEKFKAPEITHSSTHGAQVDLWGVGVLTYFMLTGRQAFRESNNARLKIAIREAKVVYEEEDWKAPLSPHARDFCQHLILKDPSARLSLEDALNHAWLQEATDTHLTETIERLKA